MKTNSRQLVARWKVIETFYDDSPDGTTTRLSETIALFSREDDAVMFCEKMARRGDCEYTVRRA